jgi:hypothetical protein
VCGRKPEKNDYILRGTAFFNSQTPTAEQTREIMYTKKKSSVRKKKLFEEKSFCGVAWVVVGGKKAQGIDRSEEMHTQGEFE